MQRLIFICTLLFCTSLIFAQPITNNSFEQKVAAAQEAEEVENYAGALDWYEQAYDEIRRGSRGNPLVKKFLIKMADLNYELSVFLKMTTKTNISI